MKLLLLLSLPILGFAQQNLEDWACGSGAVPTAGNPTTFTCSGPHNFTNATGTTHVGVWLASGGSWANINTGEQVYLRQSISATSPGSGGTLLVSDTLYLPPTGNFVVEVFVGGIEQILVNVASADTLNVVTRGYNSTTAAAAPLESEVIGPVSAAVSYPITITGANTFTIPFNSAGYGTYSGNPILIQRESFTYTSTPGPIQNTSVADGVGELNIQPTANGNALLVIPGCSSPNYNNQVAAYECARGYTDPGNQKGYGGTAVATNLVVSGGTGVLTLSSAYSYNGQEGNRILGPNQLIWIQNMNEGSNSFNAINRPWIMTSINGGMTQITIDCMGASGGSCTSGGGVAAGTYAPSMASGNLRFQPPQSLYYYFYGDVNNGAGYPTGYTQQLIKSGPSFVANDNRVQMQLCWGKSFSPYTTGTGVLELGNYFAMQPSGTAYHGYQAIWMNGYAGQCGQYVFTANFQHLVGSSVPSYFPNQYPVNGNPGYPPWTGETGYPAWEIVNHWYLNGPGLYSDFSNQTVTLGPLTMNYVTAEPEEYVISRALIYTGSAYEVDIETPEAGIAPISYQFRWSTTDLKTAGFSSGLCQSGTTTCGMADTIAASNSNGNPFVTYTSAALSSMNTIYWGIRPTIPVSGTSGNSQSPIWINTDYDPNFSAGDHVTVAGLTGNTAANQSTVAIQSAQPRRTWWYTAPTASWPTGATADNLTNIVSNGTTCTVNLTVAHNLVPGWKVLIYSSVTGDITHGYRYNVATTPTSSSFTYACPGSTPGTYAADNSYYHMAVQSEPGFSISGTGSGNWAGETTGTVVATDNTKNFAEIAFTPSSGGSGAGSTVNGPIKINGNVTMH